MTTVAAGRPGAAIAHPPAGYRYGVVLAIVLVTVVFEVLAPDADWARAVAIALVGSALTVAVATSRARAQVRRARTFVVGGIAFVVVVGIATGLVNTWGAFLVGTLVVAFIPIALGGGLLRLIRDEGVTIQAVAGALAVYLLVGLLFASAIAFVSAVQSGFFAGSGHVTNGDRVYYSFTVLTTTGFGDYTTATPVGHALAVLEMLIGQIYLVTVIGILIGNFAGRRRT
ncbi:MAG: ion channel [Solirubrobacteraceae bacterium]